MGRGLGDMVGETDKTSKESGDRHRVLGIETSCDETAVAVVARAADGRGTILSNVVRSQLAEHAAFGGVVPEIAARAHVEVLDGLILAALQDAKLTLDDIDAIAVSAGPGLIGGLLVGVMTAKAMALARGLPFLAINHLEAHALTVGLTDDVKPPYLLLLVSGGHTQLLIVRDVGLYDRLGTTVDDSLGEAFDKTAKLLGLPFPGGPAVEQAAQTGRADRFAFPRPMLGRPEPHFSFAGLKTSVRHAVAGLGTIGAQDVADICASFEAAVADAVADRVSRAMTLYEEKLGPDAIRKLAIAGGVAANKALRRRLEATAQARGFTLHVPPVALCTDNAAMVAWAGCERLVRGRVDGLDAVTRARWPLDETAAPRLGAGRLGAKA
jgi:N6-L-threonylcarbamoyladenine synthase